MPTPPHLPHLPSQVRLAHLHLRARRGAFATAKCDGAAAAPRLRRLSDWRLPAALLRAWHLRKRAVQMPPGLQRGVVRARGVDVVSRQLQRARQMRRRILRVRPALLRRRLLVVAVAAAARRPRRPQRPRPPGAAVAADGRRAARPDDEGGGGAEGVHAAVRVRLRVTGADERAGDEGGAAVRAPYTIGTGRHTHTSPHTTLPHTTYVTSLPPH